MMSRSEAPNALLCGSIRTCPKNWLPPLGGWFAKSAALTNSARGPNVGSSAFGPKVPEARIAFYFTKSPDGTWKIADIPDLFKSQQGPQQQSQQPPR